MEKQDSSLRSKKRFWSLVFSIFIWLILSVGAIALWFSYDLPDLESLETGHKRPSVVFVTQNRQEIAHYGDLYGEFITIKDLPPYVPQAVIALEDRHFYQHKGFDFMGLLRALWVNMKSASIVQGGSTLTQQIAKNVFLTPQRSLKRKIQEILFSFWLEYHFTKDQLLNIYLNRVYFGGGAYGIDAAAQEYFGKPARRLSLPETSILVAMLKAPNKLSPHVNPKAVKERASLVLKAMQTEGYLSEGRLKSALQELRYLGFSPAPADVNARFFTDWVLSEIQPLVDMSQDLIVVTTLDLLTQAKLSKAVSKTMVGAHKTYHAEQASAIAMTPNGEVKALVGGTSYWQSSFNRVTQSLRQFGSTFKLLIFLKAFEKGLTPDTLISDQPVRHKKWTPKNYGWKEQGEITLETAFQFSVNSSAIRLADLMGIGSIIHMARKLGFTHDLPHDLTLALGTASGTLLELTSAYAAVANGGHLVTPYGVLEIISAKDGATLYRRPERRGEKVLSDTVVLHMMRLLHASVYGGTSRKAALGVTLGGKTGTTQNYKDAWFVGLTKDLIMGVWVGNDNGSPMKKVTGGTLPIQIYGSFWK